MLIKVRDFVLITRTKRVDRRGAGKTEGVGKGRRKGGGDVGEGGGRGGAKIRRH